MKKLSIIRSKVCVCSSHYYELKKDRGNYLCGLCTYLNRRHINHYNYFTVFSSFNVLTGISAAILDEWKKKQYVQVVDHKHIYLNTNGKLYLNNEKLKSLIVLSKGNWFPQVTCTLWAIKLC